MYIVDERDGNLYSMTADEIKKFPNSELAIKILSMLSKESLYPKAIAKRLKENEQKIYYHMRRLEKNGLVELVSREEHLGGTAKIYRLKKPAFFMRFGEFSQASRIPKTSKWLGQFVVNGKLNAKIVVGSPDPHGIERARARDAYYGIDLALFLGTFLVSSDHSVALDTEITGMKQNMILIGGPIINRVTNRINKKLAVRFDERKNIYSALTRKTYRSDDCGIIVKAKNPFDETKWLLVIAGKRYSGTRAAILAFLKKFGEIEKKNCHVVEGVDSDGDGVVDDVRLLE